MNKKLCHLFLGVFLALAFVAESQAEEVYSVGVVPQFGARKIVKIWQPILDEVSRQAGIKLKLKTSSSIPEFEKQIFAGEFDFAYMNPYHAIVANEKQGYVPLLRDTGRDLYGIIVVKKDSPIKSVKELDGGIVAFPSPNALGAALLPRAEFVRKYNIKTDEIYVKSHSSVYLNVLLGKAIAGGGVQKTLSQQPEKIRSSLRVLYTTTKVSPHPISVHPRVNKAIQEKIKAAFLKMGEEVGGKKLLKGIPMKKIDEANLSDYDLLKTMGLEAFFVGK